MKEAIKSVFDLPVIRIPTLLLLKAIIVCFIAIISIWVLLFMGWICDITGGEATYRIFANYNQAIIHLFAWIFHLISAFFVALWRWLKAI